MQEKKCIKCGQVKLLELFHRHPGMKDGRLNKCASCVVQSVQEWRDRNPGRRQEEYRRGLGAVRAARGLKKRPNGAGPDPESHRVSSLKYAHKRKRRLVASPVWDQEFDDFVFAEAYDLCARRDGNWQIDHVVPIHHRKASGLHNGHNLQVVPASWNFRKGNRNMDVFFPVLPKRTESTHP